MGLEGIVNMNKLLTPNEVSIILNCKPVTVYSWAKTGKLPAYKLNGLLRFDAQEIDDWIKNQKINTKPYHSRISKKQDIDKIIRHSIDSILKPKYNLHKGNQTDIITEKGGNDGSLQKG